MKKILASLTAAAIVLTFASCTAAKTTDKTDTSDSDSKNTSTSQTEFTVTNSLTKDENLKDGETVLLNEKYELPQLGLKNANGETVELDSSDEANICRTFNEEFKKAAEQIDASAQDALTTAKEQYNGLDDAQKAEWMQYAESLTVETVYQTSSVLSFLGTGYVYYGGAHPTTYYRTWNFDLTTGEFITVDSLTKDNIFASYFNYAVVSAINSEIASKNLAEEYFDDYSENVSAFSEKANFYLTQTGITVVFDAEVLAPYAIGMQSFDVPYEKFYYTLSDHMQSAIEISKENAVISDYYAAEKVWEWFEMNAPETDSNDTVTKDGKQYEKVALDGINTLESLRSFMSKYFDEKVIDDLLADGKFIEENGALYTINGARGSDITIGSVDYSVSITGESGTLTQTVHRLDDVNNDGKLVDSGETDEYVYPFTVSDGHAVFSDFPCPF